ncbi:glucose-6-phosphate isomerase [Oceanibaculum pacificum]|uniref:Glucose-6-phosphate isomerase n=1 Tax=Oceanibaculum pacificum TaxID=580166 RepID=A0A154WEI5_9PROT|nr:glucose-6-phosphate isomerase [Oceanibaculum pacificum]KZD11938.1 glucose-6-phosphate isomerase [Oceanibaculum pacificum]
MFYKQDIEGCLSKRVGQGGVSEADLARRVALTRPALAQIARWHKDGSLPLLRLTEREDDLPALETIAADYRQRFDDVIVLGTGGSSLGGRTLYQLVDKGFGPPAGTPRLHFLDNVDPATFEALFQAVDFKRAGIIVISKSGGTAETLMQFLICLEPLTLAVGETHIREHVTAITEKTVSPLRKLATRYDIPIVEHDPKVGGRYSVLSCVGVLPALIAGIDVRALRQGAKSVLETALAGDPAGCAPAVGAALSLLLDESKGASQTVLMPYLDQLDDLSFWYRQLWAESLGKGGKGTTPVNALGTVDQHSQVQLYLDGPADKMFTIIMGKVAGTGPRVADGVAGAVTPDYLQGRTMGDLLDAEQRATAETLIRNNRPTRILHIDAVDAATMGALMMHFMLETIIAAHLLDVDPFDQPAVEEGKVLTREYLAAMEK